MGRLGMPSEGEIKRDKIVFIALLIALFTYGLVYCIVDIRIVFYVACPFCIYYLWRTRVNPFDLEFLFLFTSMLLVAIQAFMREPWLNLQWSNVKLVWVFPTVYVLGKVAVGASSSDYCRRAKYTLGALALGMYIQAIINYIYGFSHPHFERSSWFGFFTHDWETKNVYDFGYLIVISALYWGLKKRKDSRLLFPIVAILDIVAIGLSLTAKGRTVSAMFILINGFLLLSDLLFNWRSYSQKLHKVVLIGIGIIALGALSILFSVKTNLFSLGDKYSQSFLAHDGGIFHNIRFGIYIDALIKTIKNPEGGWTGAYENGGTHDTWLEFSRVYGTLVFVLLMLFVLISLIKCIILLSKKGVDASKYFLVGSELALFIYLTMEPVGYYPRYYILFFIFVAGVVNRVFENAE